MHRGEGALRGARPRPTRPVGGRTGEGGVRRPDSGRLAIVGRRANLLYLPALAVFAVFTVYPLVNGIMLSFTDWNGYSPSRDVVGVRNYLALLTDPLVGTALLNTVIYGFGSTIIQQILGLALAVALDRAMRGRNVARAIIYLPVMVSPVVMGTMYYLLFAYRTGGLNDLVVALGGERISWLSEASTSIGIIVAVNSLQFVGISMVIYLAGLQSIPAVYTEAAVVDGANAWQRFWRVTLPLLQPAIATSVTLNLIGGLKLFDVIRVMTGGGPGYSTESMSTLISRSYFDSQQAGYAAAIGVVLFLIIAVFTLALNTYVNRRRLEMS